MTRVILHIRSAHPQFSKGVSKHYAGNTFALDSFSGSNRLSVARLCARVLEALSREAGVQYWYVDVADLDV
jgi:hypothetical protein